jgi:RND family efflux transporter MFP subunit
MNSTKLTLPLLALVLIAGCSKQPESAVDATASLPAVKVQVSVVRAEDLLAPTEVTGTVRPVQRAVIAAKVMGTISELPVMLGQRVKTGDLLLKISAAEISAKVIQAQAQLNMAKRDLERERDLLTKNASTPDMVKGLEDRFSMTQAMVREAEVMLGYTTLTAPFDGVVAKKIANAGDLAAPGMPLLEVEGTDVFQVEAGVPDSLAGNLAVGNELAVSVPSANISFAGRLVELSSAADPISHTVQIKIAIPPDKAVRSGEFARIQVSGKAVRALFAPKTAVSAKGQMERVFLAGKGRAVLRLVKTGAAQGNRVEILSGLGDGEQIVTNPPDTLVEGQRLEVAP